MPHRHPTEALKQPAPEFFSRQVAEARRFYLDLDPPAGRAAAVVCGGLEHTRPDYQVHRTTFPFFAIEYVVRGYGTVKLRDQAHSLRPGRLFSYGPGISQEIAGEPSDPLVKYFVNFTGKAAKSLLSSCGLTPGRVSQVFPPTELQALFDELIHCGLKAGRHTASLCDTLLAGLVMKIADSRAPVEGAENLAFNTYQQSRQYIQQHFLRLRTLEQISLECRVNNAYLCRLFRRYDHQSPYQFLRRLKMNRAAERLQEPSALVKQVALETGFEDPFHFSRAFKRIFGLSPDGFRRLR